MLNTTNKQTPFVLLTIAAVITFVIGRLVCYNMFIDGVLYTAVARNLAHGKGSFWFPYFAKNWFTFFHEQPPLTLFFESLFFRIHDSPVTERLYSFFTFCINTWLIGRIWRIISPAESHGFAWLPILCWLVVPCVNWAFANCLEENTMSIFVLLSVLLQTKIIYEQKGNSYAFLAGFILVIASLCKGFPGLFPLGMMGFAWLCGFISFRKAVLHTSSILIVILLAYLALYLHPVSNESLGTYLYERVINSINKVACQNTRTWIFGHLSSGISPQIALASVLVFGSFLQKEPAKIPFKTAQLFLLLGLSGVLPLMVTKEQRGQYLVTAIPYFALMISTLIVPVLLNWWQLLTPKITRIATVFTSILLLCSIGYAYTRLGKTYEHGDKVNDYFVFQQNIPKNSEVGIDSTTWEDWDLQCNMNRLHSISFNRDSSSQLPFFIIDKKNNANSIPANYSNLHLNTQRYDLYKKNNLSQ